MKIALCTDTFLHDALGRAVYTLANAISGGGHECYVITPLCDAGYRGNIPFEVLDFMSARLAGTSRFTGTATYDKHYLTRVNALKFDLIHAFGDGPSGTEAVRLADKLTVPLIGAFCPEENAALAVPGAQSEGIASFERRYVLDFYDRCDQVWVQNEPDRAKLTALGFEGRIEIVPLLTAGEDGGTRKSGIADILERYENAMGTHRYLLKRKRGMFHKELDAIDRRLDKRKVSLVWHFLRQDMQHIYTYNYIPQKASIHSCGAAAPLPRSTPEAQGIASEDLTAFLRAIDADGTANAHAVMVARHGHVIAEGYWAPYSSCYAHQLYSLCKSITGTAIGLLVDEGRLSVDDKLVELFEERIADKATHPMRDVTVRHLLTMSSGARFDEVGTALGPDWIQEFLEDGLLFAPGDHFHYNSMNTYMLAAIVHRISGMSVVEYLRPRLFEPLGIQNVYWETCPNGIEKGGWGLSLSLEDATKIGMLYLNKGEWHLDGNPKRLLSREWVEAATSKQIDTPNGECTHGYGYQIWMAPAPGSYLFNGAFGQYLLMVPQQDAVLAVFSGTSRLFARSGMMQLFDECLLHAKDGPLPENSVEQQALENTAAGLTLLKNRSLPDTGAWPLSVARFAAQQNGKAYALGENTASVLPLILQSVHNNYSSGIDRIALRAAENGMLEITFHEGSHTNTFLLAQNAFQHSTVRLRSDIYAVAAAAVTGSTLDGQMILRLYLYYIETPCARIVTLHFQDNGVTILFDELPTVADAATMLLELSGLSRWEFYRSLLPLLKNEGLKSKLREFAVTKVAGVIERPALGHPR